MPAIEFSHFDTNIHTYKQTYIHIYIQDSSCLVPAIEFSHFDIAHYLLDVGGKELVEIAKAVRGMSA